MSRRIISASPVKDVVFEKIPLSNYRYMGIFNAKDGSSFIGHYEYGTMANYMVRYKNGNTELKFTPGSNGFRNYGGHDGENDLFIGSFYAGGIVRWDVATENFVSTNVTTGYVTAFLLSLDKTFFCGGSSMLSRGAVRKLPGVSTFQATNLTGHGNRLGRYQNTIFLSSERTDQGVKKWDGSSFINTNITTGQANFINSPDGALFACCNNGQAYYTTYKYNPDTDTFDVFKENFYFDQWFLSAEASYLDQNGNMLFSGNITGQTAKPYTLNADKTDFILAADFPLGQQGPLIRTSKRQFLIPTTSGVYQLRRGVWTLTNLTLNTTGLIESGDGVVLAVCDTAGVYKAA